MVFRRSLKGSLVWKGKIHSASGAPQPPLLPRHQGTSERLKSHPNWCLQNPGPSARGGSNVTCKPSSAMAHHKAYACHVSPRGHRGPCQRGGDRKSKSYLFLLQRPLLFWLGIQDWIPGRRQDGQDLGGHHTHQRHGRVHLAVEFACPLANRVVELDATLREGGRDRGVAQEASLPRVGLLWKGPVGSRNGLISALNK